jgi:glycine/D-amino acid oxidase-like deaminating enzyme
MTTSISPSYDVVIIGGGIVGCACAASLAKHDLKVALVESNIIGGGATAAGMGHLVVMDDNPAELALTRYSLELWRQLVSQHNGDFHRHEYSQCGTIWVAADQEEMDVAALKCRVLNEHGVNSEMLTAQQLYDKEPHLRPGLAGGVLVADDALVYPPKSAQILLDTAMSFGAQLIRDTVISIDDKGVNLASGTSINAKETIVANGISAMNLVPDLPLRYKKGHLLITDRYPQFIHHQLVELGYIKSAHASDGDSVAFNLQPRPTGQVFIGSSRQFDVTHKEVDVHMLSKMLERAASYVPAIRDLKAIRSWTGFRAATPDGLPFIGPHPSRKNIWMATGHEGLGITTSLATAELLKDAICRQTSQIDMLPYLPARHSRLS